MKQDISNYDKQGNYHGVQIDYDTNGNIRWIRNFHHGKYHGYRTFFNLDNSIQFKTYWNMDKRIYKEDHWIHMQIQINI